MKKLLVLTLLLSQVACGLPFPMWPHLPPKGTCRNFYMTDWGGLAPNSELTWRQTTEPVVPPVDVIHIDEPMLPQWGWKGDVNNPEDVCGAKGLGMVRDRIAAARLANPTSKIWLNWSTDELDMIARHCPNTPYGQGADVVSFDSYAGIWSWVFETEFKLDMLYRQLEPGQQMGLVPEAFRFPGGYPDYSPIDYVMINTLYFDWAMRHDDGGRIYAFAPFYYKSSADGGMIGFEDMPQVRELLQNLPVEYPRCQ